MPDPEPRDLRELILESAKILFSQQGYHGLAMRQISESLGVAKSALYYHFKDKEQLFLALLESYLDEVESALDSIQSQPVPSSQRVRLLVEYILRQPAEQRAIIRLASQEMVQLSESVRQSFHLVYRKKFIDKIKSILQSGMESGEFIRLDPEIATWALLGMMYPYFFPGYAADSRVPDETIRQMLTIYLEGIQPGHP
jgi:AcrR family transcriptional regulator